MRSVPGQRVRRTSSLAATGPRAGARVSAMGIIAPSVVLLRIHRQRGSQRQSPHRFQPPSPMPKTALITGITGQDGAYLAEFLLGKGYSVHGIKRRTSLFNTDRIDHLYEEPHVRDRRLDPASRRSHRFVEPRPRDAAGAAGRGLQPRRAEPRRRLVRGARIHGQLRRDGHAAPARGDPHPRARRARRASTRRRPRRCSAWSQETPQKETTPFHPRSPYGVAKLYAHWITVNYREAYGMFACNGILFNHESPVRGETFVTRKITRGARAHHARAAGLPVPRQPRRAARLGPREGLRPRDVADAAAARARGLRDRHRRAAQRPRFRRRRGGRAGHHVWRGRARAPTKSDAVTRVDRGP